MFLFILSGTPCSHLSPFGLSCSPGTILLPSYFHLPLVRLASYGSKEFKKKKKKKKKRGCNHAAQNSVHSSIRQYEQGLNIFMEVAPVKQNGCNTIQKLILSSKLSKDELYVLGKVDVASFF
ncbi:hypothetical protein CLIB1423_23S00122 [[Candida] railenensis]|uniref:Uncharacterized protein n=1 Tax=[Candida] railenensis TaxID=45579 RepID=A0A9P0QUT0_9ASCO|nr:hypothetical protein CLIB1423_23S00122 [[Candida] railenensis]